MASSDSELAEVVEPQAVVIPAFCFVVWACEPASMEITWTVPSLSPMVVPSGPASNVAANCCGVAECTALADAVEADMAVVEIDDLSVGTTSSTRVVAKLVLLHVLRAILARTRAAGLLADIMLGSSRSTHVTAMRVRAACASHPC